MTDPSTSSSAAVPPDPLSALAGKRVLLVFNPRSAESPHA